jgi:hypothetical protein
MTIGKLITNLPYINKCIDYEEELYKINKQYMDEEHILTRDNNGYPIEKDNYLSKTQKEQINENINLLKKKQEEYDEEIKKLLKVND